MVSELEEFRQRAHEAERIIKQLERKVQELETSNRSDGHQTGNGNFSKDSLDKQFALHVAASEGNKEAVELLVSKGADPLAPDSSGVTPLQNATLNHHGSLVDLFNFDEAELGDPESVKEMPSFIASLNKALSLLCEKGKWIYASALIPDNDEKGGIRTSDAWYGPSESINLLSNYRKLSEKMSMSSVGEGRGLAGRVWSSKKPEWIEDSGSDHWQDFFNKEVAKEIGFRAALGVPVVYKDKVIAILIFRATEARKKDESLIEYTMNVAKKIIMADISSSEISKFVDFSKGLFSEQAYVVYELLVQERIFSPQVLQEEIQWFFNSLGLEKYYFEQFPPHIIAQHIQSMIAAKKLARATGQPENIFLNEEKDGTAFFVCPDKPSARTEIERSIETRYLGEGYELSISKDLTKAVSIRHFISKGTSGGHKLHLYFVDIHPFIGDIKKDETDIWQTASGIFLREKPSNERERYESIIKKAVDKLCPVVEIFNESKEEVVLMLAYRKGSTHSYFSGIGQILEKSNVSATRSFLDTFSNGIAVASFHFKNLSPSSLQGIVEQATFLYMLPRTGLSPLWAEGKLNLPEVVYAFAAWKFGYHFINRQSAEYNSLLSLLETETQRNRLLQLKKRLKGEVETEYRIQETIFNHPELIKEFYAEFEAFHRPEDYSPASLDKKKHEKKPGAFISNKDLEKRRKEGNPVLEEKIRQIAETELDASILRSFLTFNAHILRTNFYKSDKVALSFRLHPRFLVDSDFGELPFAVFFFLGSDFRGFHVRFSDIARGGIRMIRSRNLAAFLHNVQTVFDENYNLALTQQKKNKDIPEGGSKGTILLSPEHQDKAENAFQKYIDSMLDLLMPNNEIVDYLRREEFIFCGPDEGTASLMDWAALHAKKRNYRFWSAFTTGKSTSLGGIPHDTYGMTTRSVHQYVLGILEKLGIDEESITKIQTGGPDGDLGSNEIKISKDKTIGVVDGSGVLYDPKGIDREELLRLANQRKMVSDFDSTKLSPNGFLILVDDKNITLPDGTKVESGLVFRNSFHLSQYAEADLFVPCGGRPEAININNVEQLIPNGVPKFKFIVEGANLFITQEARQTLEKAGVILFKDASANKGGVTSSSLEVLAAMSMTEEEFSQHMRLKDDKVPQFYQEYVKEVQEKIQKNAKMEFECIWKEKQLETELSCNLTDLVSNKINSLVQLLSGEEELWEVEEVRMRVLRAALPETLVDYIGFENIISRLPENYLRALFSSWVSSRYIYKSGLPSTPEFTFYRFLTELI